MKPIISLLILILMLSFHLNGQEVISLQRAREMALEQNQNLKIADKNLQKAEAETKAMRTLYLPSLSGSATVAYLSNEFKEDIYMPTFVPDPTTGQLVPNVMIDPSNGYPVMGPDGNPVFNMYAYLPLELSLKGAYMAGVNIEQPLFTGGKIIAANKMANIGCEMATQNIELQKSNTIAEADQSYWLYVSVREKVRLAETAVRMLDSLVAFVKNSVESGLVHQNELLKVQVKFNNATLDLQKAKSGLELTRMSLCRVVGLPFETKLVLTDTVVDCSDQLFSSFGNENIEQRPEFQLMSHQVAMEEEQIKLIRADFLPTMGVSAGYSFLGGIKFGDQSMDNNGFNIMGSLKIPLFHWGEGVQKSRSAKLSKEIKILELEKNTQLLQLEIEQAKFNLQDAFMRIKMAEKALVQSDENLRLTKDNYELGAELMTDLLIAQTQWQQVFSDLIEAKTDFKVKETQYLRVTGRLGMVKE
ncbi:MAG: TolC family protein [Salinivirgaceae bacterium]|nr:TolC family protein [Salinivirgaceae bacterium]